MANSDRLRCLLASLATACIKTGKGRRGSATAAFLFLEGSSKNKTAALAGGRLLEIPAIVMRKHSFLAGLAATYSSKS